MEKFAVDLDKVLDDFEFNEDCAEQVASSVDSDSPLALSLSKRSLAESSSNFAQPVRSSESTETKSGDVISSAAETTLDMRKPEAKRENTESINDFYNRGRAIESKVQQKRYAEFRDGEPVALTFRNDIGQKLAQKKQNEGSPLSAKNQNSYDKRLNQPNIKPSVSNVFSSLNDYINAPSGAENPPDNRAKAETTIDTPEARSKIAGDESDDDSGEEIVGSEKLAASQPPRYQNILLPVKLEPNASFVKSEPRERKNSPGVSDDENSAPVVGIGGNSGISLNSTGISVISGGVSVTSGPIGATSGAIGATSGAISANNAVSVNSGTISVNLGPIAQSSSSSSLSQPTRAANTSENSVRPSTRVEHVYENIYIPTEVQNLPEIYPTPVKSHPERETKKHVYENVDFDERDASYERIYVAKEAKKIGEKMDHEIAPRILPIVGSAEAEGFASIADGATIFSASTTERKIAKPVIGFSTIDDLSEEELNKYLADLEAEERAIEGKALYENVAYAEPTPREESIVRQVAATTTTATRVEDEDANEAPIFETVTIGELPSVSEERLQEKARKFPVIDYSKQQGTSGSVVGDGRNSENSFLEKKRPEKSRGFSGARINVEGSEKLADGNENDDDEDEDEGEAEDENEDADSKSRDDREGNAGKTRRSSAIGSISSEFGDDFRGDSRAEASGENAISGVEGSTGNNLENVEIEAASKEIEVGDFATGNRAEIGSGNAESSTNDFSARDDRRPEVDAEFEAENSAGGSGKVDEESCDECAASGPSSAAIDAEEINQNGEEDTEEKSPPRPQTLDIVSTVSMDDNTNIGSPGATPGTQERPETEGGAVDEPRDPSPDASDNSSMESGVILGKQPPFWIPDSEAPNCMLCDVKFNVIKRRHHCRACGKVLCNKCCSMKYRLEYQGNIDSRVCSPCYQLLVKAEQEHGSGDWSSTYTHNSTGSVNSPQLAGGLPPPPTVMVPVGVLKREGSSKQRPEGQKSVMFSDGIRPGCDLTELDTSWDLKPPYRKIGNKRTPTPGQTTSGPAKRQNIPPLDPTTNSYIPQDPDVLPPTVTIHKGQVSYHEVTDSAALYKSLKNDCEPPVMFAINRNLYAYVKITNLNCCVNRICWNVTSRGLACVGQDEIILLVETLPDETQIPKDLLVHINQIYVEAIKGNTIVELGVSIHQGVNFLGSREHAGFLFIRQTFQCLQKIVIPPAPFLVGLLVHRWETPWAKVFPLRLVLRLGAEYRYYPCPLVSVRFRDAVYFEIGHTIMKVLADFRNFAYTLPGVRGLTIHMQDRTTDVLFPKNRYDQVIKGLNNSNDHVLAFASNFSVQADSHLVCIQTNTGDESSYQTQAINIHNKPRKVTGASFVVINGALKSSMGLSAKSSIVEDGLMVQIMPEKMEALKAALKNMQDFSIGCGLQGAPEPDETVNIKWVDNDVQFNLGVKSPIDGKAMDGVPSIRVHNGTDYMGTSRFIRWTEVFIIKSDDHPTGVHDPVDINKLSESIARATCAALVKLLDLLATAGLTKLGVRTSIHPDNVGYEAGSEGTRLPPIYMNSLDNELIQVLHKAAQSSQDTNTVLELIFHVLDD